MAISGASGGLTQRKLIPALFNLDRQRLLPEGCLIVGVARRDLGDDEFRRGLREAVERFSGAGAIDAAEWDAFARRGRVDPARRGAVRDGPGKWRPRKPHLLPGHAAQLP